jgi:hypothetical protein
MQDAVFKLIRARLRSQTCLLLPRAIEVVWSDVLSVDCINCSISMSSIEREREKELAIVCYNWVIISGCSASGRYAGPLVLDRYLHMHIHTGLCVILFLAGARMCVRFCSLVS